MDIRSDNYDTRHAADDRLDACLRLASYRNLHTLNRRILCAFHHLYKDGTQDRNPRRHSFGTQHSSRDNFGNCFDRNYRCNYYILGCYPGLKM